MSTPLLLSLLAAPAAAQTAPTHDVPAYVDDALVVLAGADHACRATWKVANDGVPASVEITDCSGVLADAARAAAMQWAFPATGKDFTYQGVVGIVPHPLGLEDAEPVELAAPMPPPDTSAVIRKEPKVRLPDALRAMMRERDQRFAWEPCVVQVRVDANGRVTEVAPEACAQVLWPHAQEAVTRARFDPATRDGAPAEGIARLRLVYSELP